MEKIIAEIRVPALCASFDFELPAQSTAHEAAASMVEQLQYIHKCEYIDPSQAELFNADTGENLDNAPSLAAAGVKDGARLLLI